MPNPFIPRQNPPPQQKPSYEQPVSQNRTEVYNIQGSPNTNSSLLEKIAIEDLEELELSVVEQLAGYTKGTRESDVTDGNSSVLKKFRKTKEDWVPLYPLSLEDQIDHKTGKPIPNSSELVRYQRGEYPTIGHMPLRAAIGISRFEKHILSPETGTTYFDPNVTNTVELARLFALNFCFLLDNPTYEYTGNEADMSNIGVFIFKETHVLLNRSLGGFFTNKLTESTTNIYRRDANDQQGNGVMRKQPTRTEKFLSNLR